MKFDFFSLFFTGLLLYLFHPILTKNNLRIVFLDVRFLFHSILLLFWKDSKWAVLASFLQSIFSASLCISTLLAKTISTLCQAPPAPTPPFPIPSYCSLAAVSQISAFSPTFHSFSLHQTLPPFAPNFEADPVSVDPEVCHWADGLISGWGNALRRAERGQGFGLGGLCIAPALYPKDRRNYCSLDASLFELIV